MFSSGKGNLYFFSLEKDGTAHCIGGLADGLVTKTEHRSSSLWMVFALRLESGGATWD